MKTKLTLLLLSLVLVIFTQAQTLLLKENFQNWKAEAGEVVPGKNNVGVSYKITKILADGATEGTFSSNSIIVNPEMKIGKAGVVEGNGNPTNGSIALKGTSAYLELPKLPSAGIVKIKAKVGTDENGFKLQVSEDGKKFKDVAGSSTICNKNVIRLFEINCSNVSPVILRVVPTSNYTVFIFDLEVYSYKK